MIRKLAHLLLPTVLVLSLAACAGEETGEAVEFERPEAAADVVMQLPVTTGSEEAMSHFMQGQHALDVGRTLDAKASFEKAVAADPDFAHAYLNIANTATSLSEFRTNLELATEKVGGASEAEQMLVEIAQRSFDGDMEGQLMLAQRLVEMQPTSPRAWLALSQVQTAMADHEAARASAMKAIEVSPDFAPAFMALGNSYLFAEPIDLTRAAEYMQKVVELEPAEPFPYDLLGDAHRARGEFEEARTAYTRAAELDPDNGSPLQQRAHVNVFLGDYEAARADYDASMALAKANQRPAYAIYRAYVHIHEGNPAGAIAELGELVDAIDGMGIPEPTGLKINALTNQAAIGLHTGLLAEAEQAMGRRAELIRQRIEEVGTDEFGRGWEANLVFFEGNLAARRGDYETALSKAQEYMTIVEPDKDPRKNEPAHQLMGLAHLLQGNSEQAIAHFEQADQDDIYVIHHLALAHEGAGNTEGAMEMFRKVATWNFTGLGATLVRAEAQAKLSG